MVLYVRMCHCWIGLVSWALHDPQTLDVINHLNCLHSSDARMGNGVKILALEEAHFQDQSQMRSLIETNAKTIESLKVKETDLRTQIKSKSETNKRMLADVSELQMVILSRNETFRNLEAQVKSLQSKIESLKAAILKLKTEEAKTQSDIDEKYMLIKNSKLEAANLQLNLQAKNETLYTLKMEEKNLQSALETTTDTVGTLKEELAKIQLVMSALSNEKDDRLAKCEQLVQEQEEFSETHRHLEDQRRQLATSVEDAEKEKQKLLDEHNLIVKDKIQIADRTKRLRELYDKERIDLTAFDVNVKKQTANLETKLAELSALQARLDKMEEEKNLLKERCAKVDTQVVVLGKKLVALNADKILKLPFVSYLEMENGKMRLYRMKEEAEVNVTEIKTELMKREEEKQELDMQIESIKADCAVALADTQRRLEYAHSLMRNCQKDGGTGVDKEV